MEIVLTMLHAVAQVIFHEYNIEDSVTVARSYALLLYGKKGSDTDKDYLSASKCPSLLAGLECIDACSCTDCGNQNNKPEGDDGMEVDTDM
jgi:hypothetical protein